MKFLKSFFESLISIIYLIFVLIICGIIFSPFIVLFLAITLFVLLIAGVVIIPICILFLPIGLIFVYLKKNKIDKKVKRLEEIHKKVKDGTATEEEIKEIKESVEIDNKGKIYLNLEIKE